MSERRYILAVDFDGTICDDLFPGIGPPRANVIVAMRALRREGWEIVIHTCRANRSRIGEREVALCKETPEVWRRVFGEPPETLRCNCTL